MYIYRVVLPEDSRTISEKQSPLTSTNDAKCLPIDGKVNGGLERKELHGLEDLHWSGSTLFSVKVGQ
jgi:hypothetical protein